MDWMIDEAMEGRPTAGKSHDGSGNPDVLIHLTGKRHFQLEQFLRQASCNEKNPCKVHMAVTLEQDVVNNVVARGDEIAILLAGKRAEAAIAEMVG